jgi:ABC-type oligopeptide transport system substrate-binding subunit
MLAYDTIKRFSRDLKKAGLEIKIIRLNAREYIKRIAEGNYDLTFFGWIADYPDPHSIISSMFNNQLQKEGFPNLSSYGNKEILSEITRAVKESDPAKREEMYGKINRLVNDVILCIPIYQNNFMVIYNNRKIGRIVLTPLENIPLFDMKGK